MISSFLEWCSRQLSITSMNVPPYKTISLLIPALGELYVSIFTRDFDKLYPITVLLVDWNSTFLQSGSYINQVLISSISGRRVKGKPFLGLLRKVFTTFILKYISDQTSTFPNGFFRRPNLYHMGVFMPMPSYGKILADICESKILTKKSVKVSRPNED